MFKFLSVDASSFMGENFANNEFIVAAIGYTLAPHGLIILKHL